MKKFDFIGTWAGLRGVSAPTYDDRFLEFNTAPWAGGINYGFIPASEFQPEFAVGDVITWGVGHIYGEISSISELGVQFLHIRNADDNGLIPDDSLQYLLDLETVRSHKTSEAPAKDIPYVEDEAMFETVVQLRPGTYGDVDICEDGSVWVDCEVNEDNVLDIIHRLRKIATFWKKEDPLITALKEISNDARDCGCSPICQCNTAESLGVDIEHMQGVASDALYKALN